MNLEDLEYSEAYIAKTLQRNAAEVLAFSRGFSSLTKRDLLQNVIGRLFLTYIVSAALAQKIDPEAAAGKAQVESPKFKDWAAKSRAAFDTPLVLHTLFDPMRETLKGLKLDHTVLPDLDPTKETIAEARLDRKPAEPAKK